MARIGSKSTTGWKATISVAMSNYIEAGSIIAIATSLGFWQKEFGLTNLAVGLLAAFSANAFGAAVGAAIGGPLSDKFGRKFIYTYDLLLYMLGVLLAVFAVDFGMLLVAFVLTGIAVGAGVPAAWTYIAEQAPANRRAMHAGTAQLAWSMGPLIGFALAAWAAPIGLMGSRLIFALLFVVAAVTWWVRQGLPESAIWKEETLNGEKRAAALGQNASSAQPAATGRTAVAAKSAVSGQGIRHLFSNKKNITALLFGFGVYGFWGIVAGQAGIFMPRVYAKAGVSSAVEQDLLQVLVWGMTVLATLVFMNLGDRWSRRALYLIGAALGIFAWFLLVFATPTLGVLLAFAICWGVSCGIGAQAFYAVWVSELFATPYRASAQGVLFFAARVAVGLLSYGFPTLLAAHGVPYVGVIMIALLLVALLVGTIWTPKTRGKSLQEIEVERYGVAIDASPVVTSSRS
jgi:inositol transporter-like SP family MFS transporter